MRQYKAPCFSHNLKMCLGLRSNDLNLYMLNNCEQHRSSKSLVIMHPLLSLLLYKKKKKRRCSNTNINQYFMEWFSSLLILVYSLYIHCIAIVFLRKYYFNLPAKYKYKYSSPDYPESIYYIAGN